MLIISQALPGMEQESYFVKFLRSQSGFLTLLSSFTLAAQEIGEYLLERMGLLQMSATFSLIMLLPFCQILGIITWVPEFWMHNVSLQT
jgi:hypothetical protein